MSYKQIFKSTAIFGGVQVFNILIQLIRSKLIAVILGPSGMGLFGLLNSTLSLISNLSNFGLGISAVKNISHANSTGDQKKISTTIIILRRLVWLTGTFGAVLTLVFSKYLSQITFRNEEYYLAFIWLSVTILFNQITSGQLAIFQGLGRIKQLTKATLIGSFSGLIISTPFLYIYKMEGVVPTIFFSSLFSTIIAYFLSYKIKLLKVKILPKTFRHEGGTMLKMGLLLSLSGLVSSGVNYLIRIYINNTSGIYDVGLFNAGFAIINTYVGLVFSAMATDYFPRLSAIATDNNKAKNLINQQAEIAILLLSPILLLFIIFVDNLIVLLYSASFLQINDMLKWAALGMFFKAISWAIGYIMLAQGKSKVFFVSELLGNLYFFTTNILCYNLWGVEGLGISFLLNYILILIQVFFIAKKLLNFSFKKDFTSIFIVQITLAILCFISSQSSNIYIFFFSILVLFISSLVSFIELEKRLHFVNTIKNLLHRK